MENPETCSHDDFDSICNVFKIEDISRIVVEVSASCRTCGARIVFTNLKEGASFDAPSRSILGTSVALPAKLIGPPGDSEAEVGQYKLTEEEQ